MADRDSIISWFHNNQIPLTIPLAYWGLQRHLISPESIINELSNNELENLTSEKIFKFFEAANEKQGMLAILKSLMRSNIWDEDIERVWAYAFLSRIALEDTSIHLKLRKVAWLWPIFNYCEKWKSFIYYQPTEGTSSEEEVFENLKKFLGAEYSVIEKFRVE